jgi:hypothetical protein
MASDKSRRNRGQILIITSLIVMMLLVSAVVYVNDAAKNAPTSKTEADSTLSAVRQAALHTIISSLANVSNGGNISVLESNLQKLNAALSDQSYSAIFIMEYTALNETPYKDGTWLFWGSAGEGVSSMHVGFTVNSSGTSMERYSEFAVNVTASILLTSNYQSLNESARQVNVTCDVFNDDKAALAEDLTVYYECSESTGWTEVVSPNVSDYGNGTYLLSFTAETLSPTDPTLISINCRDTRGIHVWANATSTAT